MSAPSAEPDGITFNPGTDAESQRQTTSIAPSSNGGADQSSQMPRDGDENDEQREANQPNVGGLPSGDRINDDEDDDEDDVQDDVQEDDEDDDEDEEGEYDEEEGKGGEVDEHYEEEDNDAQQGNNQQDIEQAVPAARENRTKRNKTSRVQRINFNAPERPKQRALREEEEKWNLAHRRERFQDPNIRGVRIGINEEYEMEEREWKNPFRRGENVEEELDVPATHTIEKFKGPAIILATRRRDQALQYRAWPKDWKGPSRFITTLKGVTLDPAWTQDTIDIATQERLENAETLKIAESHANPSKAISKIEAQLASQLQACYDRAVEHCMIHKLLAPREGANIDDWPTEAIQAGRALFQRLQSEYSRWWFISQEATAIAARWYLQNSIDLDNRVKQTSMFDALLYYVHCKIYCNKGRPSERNSIYTPVVLDPGAISFDDVNYWRRRGFSKEVINTRQEMDDLSHASYISTACFGRTPLHGLVTWHVPEVAVAPALPTTELETVPGPNHAKWMSAFYDDSPRSYRHPRGALDHVPMKNTEEYPEATNALFDTVTLLEGHTHFLLVRTVWRDLLIPAAEEGNVDEVKKLHRGLELMIRGGQPKDWDKTTQQEDQNADSAAPAHDHMEIDDEDDDLRHLDDFNRSLVEDERHGALIRPGPSVLTADDDADYEMTGGSGEIVEDAALRSGSVEGNEERGARSSTHTTNPPTSTEAPQAPPLAEEPTRPHRSLREGHAAGFGAPGSQRRLGGPLGLSASNLTYFNQTAASPENESINTAGNSKTPFIEVSSAEGEDENIHDEDDEVDGVSAGAQDARRDQIRGVKIEADPDREDLWAEEETAGGGE